MNNSTATSASHIARLVQQRSGYARLDPSIQTGNRIAVEAVKELDADSVAAMVIL